MVNSLQDDGTEAKPIFGCISVSWKDVFEKKEARLVHGFSDSLVLFNLICIEVDVLILHLSFQVRWTTNKILYFIALIPLKSLLLRLNCPTG